MTDELSLALARLDAGDQAALLLLLSLRHLGPEPLTRLAQDILDAVISYFGDMSGYIWIRRVTGGQSVIPEDGV